MCQRPNVVFILADDMGYGDFSAFNGGLSQTPNLDAMMAEGLTLTQHYSSSAVCFPARATLMTGKYPQRVGAVDLPHHRPFQYMSPTETTIADLLSNAGYATGLVGKWHLGTGPLAPHHRGFKEAVCFHGGLMDYEQWSINRNGAHESADGRYLSDVWTEEAIAFIRRHRQGTFFLHLAYNAPHTPLQAPEADVKPFRDTGQFTEEVSTLYGMIRRMDAGVGRIMAEIERLGIAENTLVMFTSDNGPAMGKGLERYNHEFRAGKGHVYEGGIRVPMVLRWPERFAAGRELTEMVHFADWFPTILNACNVRVPAHCDHDGVDMLPLLHGEKGSEAPVRFWQWSDHEPRLRWNAAMRDGPWKLVWPRAKLPGLGGRPLRDKRLLDLVKFMNAGDLESAGVLLPEAGEFRTREAYFSHLKTTAATPQPHVDFQPSSGPELYNIADDPEERRNVAGEHPDRARRMERALEEWFEQVRPGWECCRDEDPYDLIVETPQRR